jgi:HEAT repeat protein
MRRFHRLITFFNIKPGEERVVGLLFLLAFILDLAFAFIQSMAFGIFLNEYGPASLPYSYIFVAIFGSLTAALYIKLGERVSFSRALLINLSFLGVFGVFVWSGLRSPFSHYVSFILPFTYQVSTNLGYLVIWQLAGHLFNVQQGKRLFPLLITGQWLATIFGGLLVEPLVDRMGPINLLLPAVAIFGLAILVVHAITRSHLSRESASVQSRDTPGSAKRNTEFIRNHYARLIFAFVTIWWIAYYVLDNIFAALATAQFADVNALTAFMGRLLSLMGAVALITSTVLTSRIIGRFGIRAGLLGEAVPATVIIGLLAISGNLSVTLTVMFFLAALAKLINVALGFSLSQTAYTILYQALPDSIQARARVIGDGILQPVASGVAGISLLILTTGLSFNYLSLSYVYLVVAAGLLIIISLLSRGYVKALTQVITKRRLGESSTVIADPASVTLLQRRLQDPHPSVAMYAFTKLEDLDAQSIVQVLPDLIEHPAPELRREAFLRIERLHLRTAVVAVRRQLEIEANPFAKEAGLRAFAAITDARSSKELLDALQEKNILSVRGALIGLLKYQDSVVAEEVLHRLCVSSLTADRILAAQVLGEVDGIKLQGLDLLLRDRDPEVRCEALKAAAKSRLPALYPQILEACDSPETSRTAALALIDIGADVLPDVEVAFCQPDGPRQRLLTLSKVIGRIGGTRAHTLLRSRANSPDGEVRSHILNALSECGYRAKDPSEVYPAIRMEVQRITWIRAAQADLSKVDRTALLSTALGQSAIRARDRVLLLLSLAFDANPMLRVRESILLGTTSQLTYALEIIDTQLPVEWKSMTIPLVEDLTAQEQLHALARIFPQPQQSNEARLHALIAGSEGWQFSVWVRACAIYTAAHLKAHSCHDAISAAATDSNILIRDTACRALIQLLPDTLEGNGTMLSIIEKVLILKTVDMFGQTPDDVLADVADLLEEVEVSEEETIFNKGDLGDSMYIIVDGRVRVHTPERILNYLGESDVFGEMALLDPEPRLASVTAAEPTRLLRLAQAPFFQLMAERPEVARGVIRVITRLLRDRVRDLSQLQARVKELESISGPSELK